MIKKKVNQDLRDKNIEFEINTVKYRALRFYQTKMTVDVLILNDPDKTGVHNIPFAHIPKAIKKFIKPN
ncbi:hypothetical protein [Sulfurimonas aquatica]|nr:hypothetical protein [Sulfurimonas aquatica]